MRTAVYKKLEQRIIITCLVTAFVPLLLIGITIYRQFAGMYQSKVEAQMRYRSRAQAEAVDLFLKERTAVLTAMADTHQLNELLEDNGLARLFKVMNQRAGAFMDLGVIDGHGNQRAYVGPHDLKGYTYFSEHWFGEVMSRGIYVSDVYMGYRNMPHFIIAVRRQETDGDWILRATIDSEIFEGIVRSAKIGKTGDAYIVNQQGIFQTQPRFGGKVLEKAAINPMLFGRETTILERESRDTPARILAGSWLANGKWLLVISEAKSEEQHGLNQARHIEVGVIFIGVLAIAVAAVAATRRITRWLEYRDGEAGRLNAHLVQSDKLAALGKMAAGIAHEINNPLAVISQTTGWMEDLLDEEAFQNSKNLPELKSTIRKIELHVERARKVVHSMLGYARRMEPRLEDVDVHDTLRQTIALMENYARLNNITITMEPAADLPIIAGDRGNLQQVFMNLLSNAIDAIGQNGEIHIRSRKTVSRIVIQFIDNGPGIPREQQSKIFEPFFTTNSSGDGMGLDLWVSYTIMEKIGGSLTFVSTEGEGTTFTVTIPIVSPEKK